MKNQTIEKQAEVTVHEYYQAKDGSSYFSIWGGQYQWNTYEEILEAITSYKEDPRSQWPAMSDENVIKAKKRIYKIQKVVTTTIDITNII